MKVTEMYPSKWLKAEEFSEGQRIIATIKDVRYETLGQGAKAEEKPVVEFREVKSLVLNKTNAHAIAQMHGDDSDEWIGKKIEMFTMEVDSFGDIVRAIRVSSKVPSGTSNNDEQVAPQAATAPANGDNGGITKEQKTLLVREAERVNGAGTGIEWVRRELGNVNEASYAVAEETLTWLKNQVSFKAPFVADPVDDSDPFSDS